jgi:hypothetical protein
MIKTDLTGSTLRTQIRPRKSWRIVSNFLVLAIWGAFFFASLTGFENRTVIHRSTAQGAGIIAITLVGFSWFLYVTLKALFYFEIVTVTADDLRIQGHLLSVTFSNQMYQNSSISELRYEEWSGGRSGTQNGIRFLCNGQTVTFARQADTSDSWDLIDRACEVYPFPIPAPASSSAVTPW